MCAVVYMAGNSKRTRRTRSSSSSSTKRTRATTTTKIPLSSTKRTRTTRPSFELSSPVADDFELSSPVADDDEEIGVKEIEKMSKIEKLVLTTQLFHANEHAALRAQIKTHKAVIWKEELTEEALYESMLSDPFVDPREGIHKCIMMGSANETTPSAEIVSYCIPESHCETQVCFYLPDLLQHIDAYKGKPVPNKWKNEMQRKCKDQAYADHVPDFMSESWIEGVKLHSRVFAVFKKEAKQSFEGHIFQTLLSSMVAFFIKRPWQLVFGTFLDHPQKKEEHKSVPTWLQRIVAVPKRVVVMILYNPMLFNFAVLFSKGFRAITCAYMSGVTASEIRLILEAAYGTFMENPIALFIVRVLTTIYDCLPKLVSGGFNVLALLACLKGKMNLWNLAKGLAEMSGRVLSFLVNLVLDIVEKVLGKLLPSMIVPYVIKPLKGAIHCILHPQESATWILDAFSNHSHARIVKLLPAVRKEMFDNFQLTFFWMVMAVMPATALDFLLSLLTMWFPPLAVGIDTARRFISNVLQFVTRSKVEFSVGDILLMLARQGGTYANVILAFNELYGWVCDVGGCFIQKIKIMFLKVINTENVLLKEVEQEYACCFRDFIVDLKVALKPDVPLTPRMVSSLSSNVHALGSYLWKGLGNGYSMFSDRRLKTLLLTKPLFCRHFDRKEICFYLYEWNKRARKHLSIADKGVHIGVMAQQVQTHFPDAVEQDEHGYLQVKLDALPRELTRILQQLLHTGA